MPENNDEKSKALVQISDLLGISKGADRLASALERGIGNLFAPWQKRRTAKAEIENFESWSKALEKTGLTPKAAELSLQDRSLVRLIADNTRQQENREAVGIEAITEFQQTNNDAATSSDQNSKVIDVEWVDRFWRLAQNVSNADMQMVWGKILARQATGRGAYSARCLETISLLSREEVTHLERLATLLWSAKAWDKPTYFILYEVNRYNNTADLPDEMQERIHDAAGELHREIFGPAGILLDSGSGWAQDARADADQAIVSFSIASKKYTLTLPNGETDVENIGACLGVSPLGAEIFSLINVAPDSSYITAISDAFRVLNIEMKPA